VEERKKSFYRIYEVIKLERGCQGIKVKIFVSGDYVEFFFFSWSWMVWLGLGSIFGTQLDILLEIFVGFQGKFLQICSKTNGLQPQTIKFINQRLEFVSLKFLNIFGANFPHNSTRILPIFFSVPFLKNQNPSILPRCQEKIERNIKWQSYHCDG
jgi:hypothetical protein